MKLACILTIVAVTAIILTGVVLAVIQSKDASASRSYSNLRLAIESVNGEIEELRKQIDSPSATGPNVTEITG